MIECIQQLQALPPVAARTGQQCRGGAEGEQDDGTQRQRRQRAQPIGQPARNRIAAAHTRASKVACIGPANNARTTTGKTVRAPRSGAGCTIGCDTISTTRIEPGPRFRRGKRPAPERFPQQDRGPHQIRQQDHRQRRSLQARLREQSGGDEHGEQGSHAGDESQEGELRRTNRWRRSWTSRSTGNFGLPPKIDAMGAFLISTTGVLESALPPRRAIPLH